MNNRNKSYKQSIRQRMAEQVKQTVSAGRKDAHQASCQGFEYKLWWPKIKTLVLVKPPKKQLLTTY